MGKGSEKLNLLYFINFYPTKHKIVAHDEMMEMTRRGHQITVVAVWGGEKDKLSTLHFKTIYLSPVIKKVNLIRLLLSSPTKSIEFHLLFKQYLGLWDSLRFISSFSDLPLGSTDHIHAHFANNAALKGYLLSKYLNVPFSCTGHGSELLLYPEPYLKELILNAKPFITISNYNKRKLMERYELSPSDIVVNYSGVDTEYFKRESEHKTYKFRILSVSALKEVKGIQYLIKACRILDDQSVLFRCQIIGGGPNCDDLRNLIRSNHLIKKVELLGVRSESEIKYYLLNSDLFVLPSLSEGIPVAVMEAMSMELPVIATNITGLPEIISDGSNGYLVPPKDPQALADKIFNLYSNPAKRINFAKEARRTIENKFNLKKNVTRLEKLLINHGSTDPEPDSPVSLKK